MKKLICYMAIGSLFTACTVQEASLHYEDTNRIYFVYPEYTTISSADKEDEGDSDRVNFNNVVSDSVIFSFGQMPESVRWDTAKLTVKYMGRASGQPRKYRVSVVDTGIFIKGRTTMEEGVHYQVLDPVQIFAANHYSDQLRIVVFREHLDQSYLNKNFVTLVVRLEDGEDFGVGPATRREMKLILNDYLSEPTWWKEQTSYLKFYHPEKWKILMEYDDAFKNQETLSLETPRIQEYAVWLENYLSSNVVVDKETNMRVKMDGLEPIVP